MSKAVKEIFSDSDKLKIPSFGKQLGKYEFIRRITDFYSKNKVILISEDEIANGYKEFGDIELALAEECLYDDNKCIAEYEQYLLTNINFRKGAGAVYGKMYSHDQTR